MSLVGPNASARHRSPPSQRTGRAGGARSGVAGAMAGRLAFAALAIAVSTTAAGAEVAPREPARAAAMPAAPGCIAPRPQTWPGTPSDLAAWLERMGERVGACLGDAEFLATYGALLLDGGSVDQAILWLERALLLEPDRLGVQADFAIAWALRGDRGPLLALAQAWDGRDDVPQALRVRLQALLDPTHRAPYTLLPARLGPMAQVRRWDTQAEVALVFGHESNLDRSPRLNELTLTIPDGPLVLPVTSEPRAGPAWRVNVQWQLAYAASERLTWRTGVQASARRAPGASGTDWSQAEWVGAAHYRVGEWFGRLDVSRSWLGGSLGEPFDLTRTGLEIGVPSWKGCQAHVGAETELRRQSRTVLLNARYNGGVVSLHCTSDARDAHWSVAWRVGDDRPDDPTRPGGRQALHALAAQASLNDVVGARLRLAVRRILSADAEGYSPLLENNAARRTRLTQFSLEAAWPMMFFGTARPDGLGTHFVTELQWARQRSNLVLFSYDARSAWLGVRHRW